MERPLLTFLLPISIFSFLNAISNNDLPYMGHTENSPLMQCEILLNFNTAYQGIHAINNHGWYITTKEIAQNTKKIQNQKCQELYHRKVLHKEHETLNLALIKFGSFKNPDSLEESDILANLGQTNDLEKYPWVLSLAKRSTSRANAPLQAISQLLKIENGHLILHKGTLNDFYQTSKFFFSTPLTNYYLSNDKIDKLWYFKTKPYNGVADHQDVGGAIFSYPKINPITTTELKSYLLGLTILDDNIYKSIKGETSIAIDLTTYEIKNWLSNIITTHYKQSRGFCPKTNKRKKYFINNEHPNSKQKMSINYIIN